MRTAAALLLVLLIARGGTVAAVAADAPGDLDAFAAANGLYDNGNYAEAASSYERLAALGYEDAALYYNLGNAYQKQGDIGRAILSYLRAKQLDPRDEDLTANLDLVRQQRADLIESPDLTGSLGGLTAALPPMSANELAVAALTLWTVLIAAAAAALLGVGGQARRIALSAVAGAAILLAFTGLAMAGRLQADAALDSRAVILDESVQVRSGPGDQYPVEFEIHAGAETDLLESRGAWSRISIPSPELQGWVLNTTLEAVIPSAVP